MLFMWGEEKARSIAVDRRKELTDEFLTPIG